MSPTVFGSIVTEQVIMNTYNTADSVPSNVLSTLKILPRSIFTIIFRERERDYYCSNFIGEVEKLATDFRPISGGAVTQTGQPGSVSVLLTTVLSHPTIIKNKWKRCWLNGH